MRAELFDYHLPAELIAQHPAETREGARLLAVECMSGNIEHRRFPDLVSYLAAGDCLVFNASRVRRARLRGRKVGSGGEVEILLVAVRKDGTWEALARPARRLRRGTVIALGGELEAEVVEMGEKGEIRVRLRPGELPEIEAAIEDLGEVPLPPYIKEALSDPERYQTVFACEKGSAAAPTAGLHFGLSTLQTLQAKGVRLAFLRLDVGLDTFRPIEEDEVEDHHIHSEEMFLDEEACEHVNATRREGGRVVAVGTTVVRALESAATGGVLCPRRGPTDLYIYPGFRFQAVDCLVTNFHMPRSTLLLLVCAFAGRELVMEAYRRAVEERYRFLSFGDACYFHYTQHWGVTENM
ncbi:MAG: tRNA preQ1(34) S-adenosylmethionine ribosyltransferase-isomerase QueA [Actinobacteria bacterium]|jgi:S-adenosylmethionine:tRNA ribosyltransferase-isomerase|nr:MAG: tRNA preQ1(34) S-adenosylmethionine ribosyltransferase-isomerase QueA [Actinomycetota bacterium]